MDISRRFLSSLNQETSPSFFRKCSRTIWVSTTVSCLMGTTAALPIRSYSLVSNYTFRHRNMPTGRWVGSSAFWFTNHSFVSFYNRINILLSLSTLVSHPSSALFHYFRYFLIQKHEHLSDASVLTSTFIRSTLILSIIHLRPVLKSLDVKTRLKFLKFSSVELYSNHITAGPHPNHSQKFIQQWKIYFSCHFLCTQSTRSFKA